MRKRGFTMNKNNKEQHKRGLDTLRGIGITGIVLYHLFPSVVRGGFLGVPLFFVLSGYLMFTTGEHAFAGGNFHIGQYYKKRIKRILPPLFIMVMAVCCYLTLTKSSLLIGMRHEICSIFLGYDNWWQITRNASYFSSFTDISPFTHLWFLAVEIQFYLLWPLLFLFYKKCCQVIGGKKMCFFFLLLALLSAGKMFFLYTPGEDPSRVYYGTDTMAFPLFIGMFLGAVRQEYKNFRLPDKRSSLLCSGIFCLIIFVLFFVVDGQYRFLYQGGMFLLSLFFALMIPIMENREHSPDEQKRPPFFSFLGKNSYGIYLWHYPLIVLAVM